MSSRNNPTRPARTSPMFRMNNTVARDRTARAGWAALAASAAWVALSSLVPATATAQTRAGRPQTEAPDAAASAPAGPTVREAVATPMNAAQALLKEGKAQEAMAKVDEAAKVPTLTPYEAMIIERTRAAAAQRLGQGAVLIQAVEAALATGQVAPADELGLVEALVASTVRDKDHKRTVKWGTRYNELKGTNDSVRLAVIQAQIETGDEAGALAALKARMAAADSAGQAVPEPQLRQVLALQQKAKDADAAATLERLALAYPRKEYWADLTAMASRTPNLPDRSMLELYRLLRTVGHLPQADMREEFAQLAISVGQPGEALAVLEEGYASGQLGVGKEAAAHNKLRDQARRLVALDKADRVAAEAAARRAADGNVLTDLGWATVGSLPTGSPAAAVEPGLALLEQGVAKGGLRRPLEARLHLGIAQLQAGRRDAARDTLGALAKQPGASTDALSAPIRLWQLYATVPALLPAR